MDVESEDDKMDTDPPPMDAGPSLREVIDNVLKANAPSLPKTPSSAAGSTLPQSTAPSKHMPSVPSKSPLP